MALDKLKGAKLELLQFPPSVNILLRSIPPAIIWWSAPGASILDWRGIQTGYHSSLCQLINQCTFLKPLFLCIWGFPLQHRRTHSCYLFGFTFRNHMLISFDSILSTDRFQRVKPYSLKSKSMSEISAWIADHSDQPTSPSMPCKWIRAIIFSLTRP